MKQGKTRNDFKDMMTILPVLHGMNLLSYMGYDTTCNTGKFMASFSYKYKCFTHQPFFFLRYKSIVLFTYIPTMLSMRVWFTNSLYSLLHGMNMISFYRCNTT